MQKTLTYEIDQNTYDRYVRNYTTDFAALVYFGQALNVLTDLSFTRIHCTRDNPKCRINQLRESLSRRASCLGHVSQLIGQFREHYRDQAAFLWFEYHWFKAPHEKLKREPPSLGMRPFNLISYDPAVREHIRDLDLAGGSMLERSPKTELLAAPADPGDFDQHREIYESLAEVIEDMTKCYQFCAVQFIQCITSRLGIPKVTAKSERAAA